MSSDDDINAQMPEVMEALRALGEVFLARIPGYLLSMEDEINKIQSNNSDNTPLENLHRQLHTIAGSAGSFGYDEFGKRARQCERRINDLLKSLNAERPHLDYPLIAELNIELHEFMQWTQVQFKLPEAAK